MLSGLCGPLDTDQCKIEFHKTLETMTSHCENNSTEVRSCSPLCMQGQKNIQFVTSLTEASSCANFTASHEALQCQKLLREDGSDWTLVQNKRRNKVIKENRDGIIESEEKVEGEYNEDIEDGKFQKVRKTFKRKEMMRTAYSMGLKTKERKAFYKHMRDANRNLLSENVPHMFRDMVTQSLKNMIERAGMTAKDKLFDETERLVLLYIQLSDASNTLAAFASIITYVKSHVEGSIYSKFESYIKYLMGDMREVTYTDPDENDPHNTFDSEARSIDPLLVDVEGQTNKILEEADRQFRWESRPKWLKDLAGLKDNWSDLKDALVTEKLSKLLGLLVVIGLVDKDKVSFKISDIEIFGPDLNVVHKRAGSIVDACFDTVVFFVEVMYACWADASIRPLITGAQNIDVDETIREIREWWPIVQNGNLKRYKGIEDCIFVDKLEKVIDEIERRKKHVKDKMSLGLLNRLVNEMYSIRTDYSNMKLGDGTREAPFSYMFYGGTGQSKTFIQDQITKVLLASEGLSTDENLFYTRNTNEQFWSGFRSDMLVVKFDDFVNSAPDKVTRNPYEDIIAVCNNEKFVVPMADLESKGKNCLRPEIVTGTTNSECMQVNVWSVCPSSCARRWMYFIVVKLKPEYTTDNTLGGPVDKEKCLLWRSANPTAPLEDIWSVTVQVFLAPKDPAKMPDKAIVEWNGLLLKEVDVYVLARFLTEQFKIHRNQQKTLMETKSRLKREICLCGVDGCDRIKGLCVDHPCTWEPVCLTLQKTQVSKLRFIPLHANDEPPEYSDEYGRSIRDKNRASKAKKRNNHPHSFIASAAANLAAYCAGTVYDRLKDTDSVGGDILFKQGKKFWDDNGWLMFLPESLVRNRHFKLFMMAVDWRKVKKMYAKKMCMNVFAAACFVAITAYTTDRSCPDVYLTTRGMFRNTVTLEQDNSVLRLSIKIGSLISSSVYCAARMSMLTHAVREEYEQEMIAKNAIHVIDTEVRDEWSRQALTVSALLASAYLLVQTGRASKSIYNSMTSKDAKDDCTEKVHIPDDDITYLPNGNLIPVNEGDIDERDLQENPFVGVEVKQLPHNARGKTMTLEHLFNQVKANLFHVTVERGKQRAQFNALAITTNCYIVPLHTVKDPENFGVNYVFRHNNPETSGGKFTYKISDANYVEIEGVDLALVYIGSGGDRRNIIDCFSPAEIPYGRGYFAQMLYRRQDGTYSGAQLLVQTQAVTHRLFDYMPGGAYHVKAFNGLCGAPICCNTTVRHITGVHIGGNEKEDRGIYASLTQEKLNGALTKLCKIEGVLVPGSTSDFNNCVLGKEIVISQNPPEKKSPVNYLPKGSQVQYFGQCVGKVTPMSHVRNTPISEYITKVFAVENKWGKPTMKPAWRPYQQALSNLAMPAEDFKHEDLAWAVEDYKRDLLHVCGQSYHQAKPLKHDEVLNGIPGKRFIDPMDFKTSIGLPLTGPKSEHVFEYTSPDGIPKKEFESEIITHIVDVLKCYARGERANVMAKACTKDEALPVEKEKCRIFYGNMIALIYALRKYYLPIARVMMMNPIVSECAVGVNSHGPEWQQLDVYMRKFPNLIGGDYSKYDQKLPSQLINAAFRILIDCGAAMGYAKADLDIMKAISADVIYPFIAYNGDLIKLISGGHISGNSLTVIINGICGSLNLRIAYKNICGPEIPFRQKVALMTYGDDNAGSSSDERFGIKAISEFLEKYGQKYTMPDKHTELKQFLDEDEFEFLKRKSKWIPEIQCTVGVLDEMSIFKSLHCHVYGKKEILTPEEKVVEAMRSACTEWFNHGRCVYDIRIAQLKRVAEMANLQGCCPFLDISYDDRVHDWFNKYAPTASVTTGAHTAPGWLN